MPLYEYICLSCEEKVDLVHTIAERSNVFHCQICGGELKRQLSRPMIQMDYPGYTCPVTGRWIEGRRQHEENLRRHGCRILETGEKEEVLRKKAESDRQLEETVGETIAREVAALPPAKLSKLCNEIEHGATTVFERR